LPLLILQFQQVVAVVAVELVEHLLLMTVVAEATELQQFAHIMVKHIRLTEAVQAAAEAKEHLLEGMEVVEVVELVEHRVEVMDRRVIPDILEMAEQLADQMAVPVEMVAKVLVVVPTEMLEQQVQLLLLGISHKLLNHLLLLLDGFDQQTYNISIRN
jgi:hypothetical protein